MSVASKDQRTPLERLGLWNGESFTSVESGAISQSKVFVMSHGWCRGMLPTLETIGGHLAVWDPQAETDSGGRFDGWYGPLADAIITAVPDAAVIGFTWLDDAATGSSSLHGVRSQMRTTVNGQRLAVGLESALTKDTPHDVHLIGFSHGAKVVTVAAALLTEVPVQVTLLDSPEGTLPVLGGALNDLSPHLRVLQQRSGASGPIHIDSYPSFFGGRYGSRQGLGSVVDVALDPDEFPLKDDQPFEPGESKASASLSHGYAWRWYVESARHLEYGVGFGWSPMLGREPPADTQLRQRVPRSNEARNPFALEQADVRPGTLKDDLIDRARRQKSARLLSTDGKHRLHGLFWRRRGDLFTVAPLKWRKGTDRSEVRVIANRTERGRIARGWGEASEQQLPIHLGGVMSGPVFYTIHLESDAPAAVEVYPSPSVYGVRLPMTAELNVWIYPALMTALSLGFAAIWWGLSKRLLRSLRRSR
jgi:hypothetical protein